MSTLRQRTIRLAHARPDLQPYLLRVVASIEPTEVLISLGRKLDDLGFPDMKEGLEEFLGNGGKGWRGPEEYLAALRKDVWWNFRHVGEEGERHIYQEAEHEIEHARQALR